MCNVLVVAKEICKAREWNASNLELQKLLYIAQVVSLGSRDKKIFDAKIEAWEYGPVVPEVYHLFKIYGSLPIPLGAFPRVLESPDDSDKKFIETMAEETKGLAPWVLVAITHRNGTAWTKNYNPNKNKVISDSDMRQEYLDLWRPNV